MQVEMKYDKAYSEFAILTDFIYQSNMTQSNFTLNKHSKILDSVFVQSDMTCSVVESQAFQ